MAKGKTAYAIAKELGIHIDRQNQLRQSEDTRHQMKNRHRWTGVSASILAKEEESIENHRRIRASVRCSEFIEKIDFLKRNHGIVRKNVLSLFLHIYTKKGGCVHGTLIHNSVSVCQFIRLWKTEKLVFEP